MFILGFATFSLDKHLNQLFSSPFYALLSSTIIIVDHENFPLCAIIEFSHSHHFALFGLKGNKN